MIFFKCFHCLNFSHTGQEGNNLAHNLAKHSLNVLDILVWMKDVLPKFHCFFKDDLGLVWITMILSDITQFSSLSFQNAWVPSKKSYLA